MATDIEEELRDLAAASAVDPGCDGCKHQGSCHQSRTFGCQLTECALLQANAVTPETEIVAKLTECLEICNGNRDNDLNLWTNGERLAALSAELSDLRHRAEQLGV